MQCPPPATSASSFCPPSHTLGLPLQVEQESAFICLVNCVRRGEKRGATEPANWGAEAVNNLLAIPFRLQSKCSLLGDLIASPASITTLSLKDDTKLRDTPTIWAETCPGEQHILDLTSRPWQGPPRSFFWCGGFPESGMRAQS